MTPHPHHSGQRQARNRAQRGITLIETCTTIAVAAVLASSTVPGMQSLIDARRLDGVAAQLATDVQFVRTESVARNEALRLSFRPLAGGSCYVIHTGTANQCDCSGSGAAVCQPGAREIRTVRVAGTDHVSLQPNVASLLFDPLHGTVSPTGTLRVVGSDGRAVHQIVNIMGRVRGCSPGAVVPGYRAC